MCVPWEQEKPAEVLHFIRAFHSFVDLRPAGIRDWPYMTFSDETWCKHVSLAGVFTMFSVILDVPVRMSRQLATRVCFEQMHCEASSALL